MGECLFSKWQNDTNRQWGHEKQLRKPKLGKLKSKPEMIANWGEGQRDPDRCRETTQDDRGE